MDLLVSTVQHYAWGDRSFIAELQSRPPSGRPEAELWMGAHGRAPSRLERTGVSLDEEIARDPVGTLGAAVASRFGSLPFLAKVLASAQPLSIQTHPNQTQARAGFDRELRSGIPPESPQRIYPDPNHKPELICALTAFEAKCGFRELSATRALFDVLGGAALQPVRERLAQTGADAEVLADLLAWLLTRGGDEQAVLAAAAVKASEDLGSGPFAPDAAWSAPIARLHGGDVGVVVALLLNHVVLQPGQALFLGAGNLHSYLRGAGIEVMANSDNVIRGGLTQKHVDVGELLRVVDCSPSDPPVQTPQGSAHRFRSDAPEFSLTRLVVASSFEAEVDGPEIVLVTEGELALVDNEGDRLDAPRGTPIWIPACDGSYSVRGRGVLYRVRVA